MLRTGNRGLPEAITRARPAALLPPAAGDPPAAARAAAAAPASVRHFISRLHTDWNHVVCSPTRRGRCPQPKGARADCLDRCNGPLGRSVCVVPPESSKQLCVHIVLQGSRAALLQSDRGDVAGCATPQRRAAFVGPCSPPAPQMLLQHGSSICSDNACWLANHFHPCASLRAACAGGAALSLAPAGHPPDHGPACRTAALAGMLKAALRAGVVSFCAREEEGALDSDTCDSFRAHAPAAPPAVLATGCRWSAARMVRLRAAVSAARHGGRCSRRASGRRCGRRCGRRTASSSPNLS